MRRFALCCVDPTDGSLDSVVCFRRKQVRWCGVRSMPSTSFLDDLASADMTHNEDVTDLIRVFESMYNKGGKPDIPTTLVVFRAKQHSTLREWEQLYKEADEKIKAGDADMLKSWAMRKKVHCILDNGRKVSYYTE